jgi:two-component system, LytTR family, response regulator
MEDMMRALIVDDEPLARRVVTLMLRRFRDVEIVGQCGDGLSAVEAILGLAPDLVFLDVQMPGMDGFEVLRAIPKQNLPTVVFVTAYEQHALRAFEAHAIDYLLKPIDEERFALAVERARALIHSAAKVDLDERIMKLLGREAERFVSRFAVRSGSRIQIVLTDDIDWIGAAGDYAELHSRGRAYLVRESMRLLEQKLDAGSFLRIHRSRIVRIERIRELQAIDNREYLVKLSDGSEHRSGRTYADRLEQWLASGA